MDLYYWDYLGGVFGSGRVACVAAMSEGNARIKLLAHLTALIQARYKHAFDANGDLVEAYKDQVGGFLDEAKKIAMNYPVRTPEPAVILLSPTTWGEIDVTETL